MVHVEASPGIVIVVPAWMLDAVACTAMELGAPRASVQALAELHLQLSELGLRRSFAGVQPTGEQSHDPVPPHDAQAVDRSAVTSASAAATEHVVRVRRAAGTEIDRVNQRGRTLALLLLQAAGLDAGGDDGEL